MHRQIVLDCLPYFALMAVCLVLLRSLVKLSGVRLQLSRLGRLHRDQVGGVQSLSFVLTVPIFVLILMFLVQVSQVVIARIFVEYAAYAAARSAIVWIPANLSLGDEQANRIGASEPLMFLYEEEDEDGRLYTVHEAPRFGWKYAKIKLAAAMACLPMCPSRDLPVSRNHPGNFAAGPLASTYQTIAPASVAKLRNPSRLRARLENKLAYALENTEVSIRIRHKIMVGSRKAEPPLITHFVNPYPEEFAYNEIGYKDQVLVTVGHNFALLPGPGRLLARRYDWATDDFVYGDAVASFGNQGGSAVDSRGRSVFVYALKATVQLTNEGEKSVLPYFQDYEGWPLYAETFN